MRFRVDQTIRAPRASAEAAFVDPRFYEALGSLGTLSPPEILSQGTDPDDPDVVHLKVRYRFVGHVSMAVSLVLDPAKLSWIDHSTFHRNAHRIDFDMVAEHYPSRLACRGCYAFEEDPSDPTLTHQVVEGDVTVDAVVASLVERAIISGLTKHLASEATLVERWAAGQPAH